MNSQSSNLKRLDDVEEFERELLRYLELFAGAFDELHGAVTKQAKAPGQNIGPHPNYPIMSRLAGGFPSFDEAGFYRDESPRDYVGMVLRNGADCIIRAFGHGHPDPDLPKRAELASFLRNHEIGNRLRSPLVYEDTLSDWRVDELVADAVERYLHLYGLDTPVEAERRDAVIRPLVFGTVSPSLHLSLVVPIALTHFEVDHFPLTETTYITRMPKKLQLGRARMSTVGSGAVKMVVGAATHAFVSNGWTLDVDNVDEVRSSLRQPSSNALDAIDSFLGALRMVAGISTGYAQILWVPRRWTLDYFCDLTPVYSTTLRRYPNEFDNFGWMNHGATIKTERLNELRRIYRVVVSSQSEAIRLALSRLNSCLTRTDGADAVLDGTIGLELLLGDDQNQSLSYKLRLRAAALAILRADPAYPPAEVASKVKRLYEARSAIVHGKRKKPSKKASGSTDTRYSEERLLASELLRFILNVLLTNPKYQDPTRIDEGLLLRGDEIARACLHTSNDNAQ